MKYLLSTFCLIFFLTGVAQVTFQIDSLPDYTPAEDVIYIAGDFTGWNPGHPDYALSENHEGIWSITLDSMPEGTV